MTDTADAIYDVLAAYTGLSDRRNRAIAACVADAISAHIEAREAAAAEAMREQASKHCAGVAAFLSSPDEICVAMACAVGVGRLPLPAADALVRLLDQAKDEERKACLDIVSKRAASRFNEATHCLSDRSRKHMQIRADEAGQIAALIRARRAEP